VLTRLVKASFRNDFNFSNLQMGSVILECIPWPGCQAAYRIYSNKRRSAYLIFRTTSEALIQGRRLFQHCTRQIYFFLYF